MKKRIVGTQATYSMRLWPTQSAAITGIAKALNFPESAVARLYLHIGIKACENYSSIEIRNMILNNELEEMAIETNQLTAKE